jgi:uncharacterized protein (DUF1697 family)
MADVQLALLRAINVGGKNIVPMRDLTVIFQAAGCLNVRTFIQSGNVIFTPGPKTPAHLPAVVSTKISEQFGLRVPVILRTAKQLRETISHNPLPGEEEALSVMFLADLPEPAKVAALDANRSRPDRFFVRGREIYLHLPNGARSKLTNAWFDAQLSTVSTVRNWRTVNKLLSLMEPE